MSVNSETAQERLRLADRFIERGDITEALFHIDAAQDLLLREHPDKPRVEKRNAEIFGPKVRAA